ncbi:MAG: putative lipid II flippase FtsW [Clostridiales bacterium]|jgi:cell division protein FtsW|nr:putative lipid II flippase FtsW [Clostridiales bacterium]
MKWNQRLHKFNLRHYDFWIFLCVMMLLAIGLVMIFSSSAPSSVRGKDGDAYSVFRNQLRNTAIGFAGMLVLSFVPYRLWSRLSPLILLGALALLGLVVAPGFADESVDVHRWLYIGSFGFQPSELAKFAMVCFLSASLAKRRERLKYFFKGFLPYFLLIVANVGLLMIEPHLSGSLIIVGVSSLILFTAGAKIRHFFFAGAPLVAGAVVLISVVEKYRYILDRVLAFQNPGLDPLGDDWQIVNSLYAIGSGGLFGRGIGRSMQKFLYIPEPYNDFIFSVMAEELGFIGVASVLILFGVLIWRGFKVSIMAGDLFGSLFALGITSLIAIQALFNIAVVTRTVPVTGVSLPFFSYGGTSMIMFLGEIGILLNISKSAHVDTVLPVNELRAAEITHIGRLRKFVQNDD